MNKLRKIFEGDYEINTSNIFMNSKIYLAISIIGCIFSLISFIIALVEQKTSSCMVFLITLLVCMNCGIEYFNNRKYKCLK